MMKEKCQNQTANDENWKHGIHSLIVSSRKANLLFQTFLKIAKDFWNNS